MRVIAISANSYGVPIEAIEQLFAAPVVILPDREGSLGERR